MIKYKKIRLLSNTLRSKIFIVENNNKYFIQKKFYSNKDLNKEYNKAKILNNLENPYFVKFIELYDNNLIYEYFESDILDDIRYNITPSILFKILQDITRCLYLLEKKGYYHLDISLSNILINKDNNIKIIDYSCLSNNNNISDNPGSFYFVPPEYLINKKLILDKFDVFSIGHILFILLFKCNLIKSSKCYMSKCWSFCKNDICNRNDCLSKYLDSLIDKFKIKKIYKKILINTVTFDYKKRFSINQLHEMLNNS
jgi:serine/threonine protein kinase